ncbi:MAG: hypothetical protein A2V85_09830 [Chloroflexi bacterium RBG_16_72_14]|nr:MAG: hypothetical protein A2V85_09830 [Chloroflexi bacterium RBG_16_72_14]
MVGGSVDRLVRWVVIPVTSVIPVLVRTGALVLVFGALWVGIGVALVVDPAAVDAAWQSIGSQSPVVQAVAWLLFLPLMGGLWVWSTDWPLVARIVLIAALAGWNLLVFIPRRETASPVAAQ